MSTPWCGQEETFNCRCERKNSQRHLEAEYRNRKNTDHGLLTGRLELSATEWGDSRGRH